MLIVTDINSMAIFKENILTEFRCSGIQDINGEKKRCNKLLAKFNKNGIIAGEIKCQRCGAMNNL